MTTSLMNSSPSGFHVEPNEDHEQHHHHHHQFFGPNQELASSSSYSYQFYFNSTQDQTGYYPSEAYQPQQQIEGDDYVTKAGSYEVENKEVGNGLMLSLGKIEGKNGYEAQKNPVKWMSSKMRLMEKMKNSDSKGGDELSSSIAMKFEDQKMQPSSSFENGHSSNGSSNNSNTPIRVCADCNTTKTPLWRSGPKGPKSLCNACGIRQRKARRAMAAAAAAAAANGTPFATETPTVKIKLPSKEKTKSDAQTVPFKKRCKAAINAAGTSQEPKKKLGFEDFLINLSKNLAFHHVFPQDEKEAAILLMALSCGLVHG